MKYFDTIHWVLKSLEHGLVLETTSQVPPFEEPNNKSCNDQFLVMQAIFTKELTKAKIDFVYKKLSIY